MSRYLVGGWVPILAFSILWGEGPSNWIVKTVVRSSVSGELGPSGSSDPLRSIY